MKAILFLISVLILFIGLSLNVNGQTYIISDTEINTCGGTIYDTGGAGANYGNNEEFTMVVCSDNGSVISLQFTQFNLAAGDLISIYNGVGGLTNLLASGTGTELNGQTIEAVVDCITIVWYVFLHWIILYWKILCWVFRLRVF